MSIPFTSHLGFLLWRLSQSVTSQGALFTSYLSVRSFLTQLTPTLFLFSAFLSNCTSNDYPHWLKETLASLTELRSLIRDGSRCQTRSANWLGGKGLDYRLWSHACEIEPWPLLTVPLPVHICNSAELALESTDFKVFVGCLCSQGIFWLHTYYLTLNIFYC